MQTFSEQDKVFYNTSSLALSWQLKDKIKGVSIKEIVCNSTEITGFGLEASGLSCALMEINDVEGLTGVAVRTE